MHPITIMNGLERGHGTYRNCGWVFLIEKLLSTITASQFKCRASQHQRCWLRRVFRCPFLSKDGRISVSHYHCKFGIILNSSRCIEIGAREESQLIKSFIIFLKTKMVNITSDVHVCPIPTGALQRELEHLSCMSLFDLASSNLQETTT